MTLAYTNWMFNGSRKVWLKIYIATVLKNVYLIYNLRISWSLRSIPKFLIRMRLLNPLLIFFKINSGISYLNVFPKSLPWFRGRKFQEMEARLGLLLLTEISYTSIRVKAWIHNYIYVKQWDVITHPCPKVNGGLTQLWIWIFIHALTLTVIQWITVEGRACMDIYIHNYMQM